jgi:hypothetical protein
MSRFALIAVLMASLGAPAWLASAAAKPLTKPKKIGAAIKATFSAPIPLPCKTGTSYAANCPGSSGACSCVTLSGSAAGGLGKGPVTGALTLDGFDASPEGGCTPFYGSLAVTNTKDGSINTLDITGALCNSTPAGGTQTIGGGFDFDAATVGLTGTGSLAGTIPANGTAKLELSGVIAPASNTAQ